MYYSVETNQQQLAEQQIEYTIPFGFEKVYAHMILYRNFWKDTYKTANGRTMGLILKIFTFHCILLALNF